MSSESVPFDGDALVTPARRPRFRRPSWPVPRLPHARLSLIPRPLLHRSHERELLEAETLDQHEMRANLRELAMLNRLPGGTSDSIAAIELLANGVRDLTIVDLGTGGGETAVAFAAAGRRGVARWRVLAVDNHPDVLEVARHRTARAPEVEVLLADARDLPLDDASVDIAHASLLLHHLDPQDAVAVLAEMARVARLGIVINDLRRGTLPYLITMAVTLGLTRSRYTHHDGLASARRAYTIRELDELLHAAGLMTVSRSNTLLPRVVTAAVPI